MAYAFVGASSQQITSSPEALLNGAGAITLAYWVNRSAGTTQTVGFTEAVNRRFQITPFTDNKVYANSENGATIEISANLSPTSGIMHMCVTFDGSLSPNTIKLKAFQNGAQVAAGGGAATTISSTLGTFRIGRYQSGNLWTNGQISEVAIWSAALTADEISGLSRGFSPRRMRPQSLRFYTPLVRNLSEIQNALSQTNSNGATVVRHPRRYG